MPNASAKKTKSVHKKNGLQWLLASIITLFILSNFFLANISQPFQLGSKKLSVEIVSSEVDRARGLSGRDSISDQEGMLFVFEETSKHCFWMKGMKFPIDIIWLDESWKVVHVAASVPPESYPSSFCPEKPARYVLEVQTGLTEKTGVSVGSQL
jgi:uncharacterized protein